MTRNLAVPLLVVFGLMLVACDPSGTGDNGVGANTAPIAEAGQPRTVSVGQEVVLDGSGSSDPNGDMLRFSWKFASVPPESGVSLSERDTASPRFTPDVPGDYDVELTVSDGIATATDRVRITAGVANNELPVADAGADQVVSIGAEVQLDGRDSTDPQGNTLAFEWEFLQIPDGSQAAISDPTSRTPRFTADLAGDYQVRLTVSHGENESSDLVEIRANRSPTADAGSSRNVSVGSSVLLDGTRSSDPDGDSLSYRWHMVLVPPGSNASLGGVETPNPTFTADVVGDYTVELIVDDGVATASDRVTITAQSSASNPGSVLYVSTQGSDTNSGTSSQPLATLRKALEIAKASASVNRIQMAAGTYAQSASAEPFDYTFDGSIDIVGDGPDLVTLQVSGVPMLTVGGVGFVTLLGLTIEYANTNTPVLDVGDSASLSMVEVRCEGNYSCLQSGRLWQENGGSVSIVRSSFLGQGKGGAVIVSSGDRLDIRESTIDGFDTGVSNLGTPMTVNATSILNNVRGMELFGESTATFEVRETTFTSNQVGIFAFAAPDVNIVDTSIVESSKIGLQIEYGGAVVLQRATIRNGDGDGIVVEHDFGAPLGAVVTVRDSEIYSHLGYGLAVYGPGSVLDLGNGTSPGNNAIEFNKLGHLHDERPDSATGLINISETRLGFRQPPAGTYSGPNFSNDYFRIVNKNKITVY